MYVQLKLSLDCEPEAAWRALRSVAVVREIYAPVIDVRPVGDFIPAGGGEGIDRERVLSPGTMWEPGSVDCDVRLFGLIPVGRQTIRVGFDRSRDGEAHIFSDTGGASAGPLSLLRGWRHRMAVSPLPGGGAAPDPARGGTARDPGEGDAASAGGRTLWRDRVEFHGPFAAIEWPVIWLIWQFRGARIRRLAAGWSDRDRGDRGGDLAPGMNDS